MEKTISVGFAKLRNFLNILQIIGLNRTDMIKKIYQINDENRIPKQIIKHKFKGTRNIERHRIDGMKNYIVTLYQVTSLIHGRRKRKVEQTFVNLVPYLSKLVVTVLPHKIIYNWIYINVLLTDTIELPQIELL